MADPLAAYQPAINAAAAAWGHDPDMLRALIMQESSGNPNAVSKRGARGLTGLMPATAAGVGVTDPADPTQQIFGGAKYLAEGRDKERTPEGALLYYHGGPDWRKAYGPESQGYVPAVADRYSALKAGNAHADVPSDADFLNMTAPPAKSAGPAADVPSDADFLKMTGAAPGAEPAPASPATAPPSDASLGVDDFGRPIPAATAAEMQPVPIPGRIPATIAEARRMLAPPAGYVPISPLGFALKETTPGSGVADPNSGLAGMKFDPGAILGARGAGNALLDMFEGMGPAVTGEPASPLAGKVSPAASALLAGVMAGGGLAPSIARGTGAAIADTAAYGTPVNRLYGPRGETALPEPNRLAAAPEPPPQAAAGGLPQGAALPQSVGAAASRDLSHPSAIEMTPAQVQAYRSTAEGQKLLEPQQPGIEDARTYVPGVSASNAEIEQTVNAARDAKTANVAYPDVSQAAKETAAANNDIRARYLEATIKSPVDVMNAVQARSAQAEADLAAAFGNKTAADASPVADTIRTILDTPRGAENTALQQYVRPLLGRLQNADGSLKTDPEQLYGLREDISRLQSKAAQAETPTLSHVSGELGTIKSALDAAIEPAAPGYQQYLRNYADASRTIDEMQVLQGHQNGLYDTQGRMQLSRVQNMMRNIVDSRAASGLNQYKSVSDETMQRLWNLRDDLRRTASAQELARTPGSDTTQTAYDLAKRGAAVATRLAAHGIANHVAPFLGSLAVNAADSAIGNRLAARAQKRGVAQAMHNLNPNRLIPPEP